MKRKPRRSRRAWRHNWPARVVVSGALKCIVRKVVGWLAYRRGEHARGPKRGTRYRQRGGQRRGGALLSTRTAC
jgi:hypothetical protein